MNTKRNVARFLSMLGRVLTIHGAGMRALRPNWPPVSIYLYGSQWSTPQSQRGFGRPVMSVLAFWRSRLPTHRERFLEAAQGRSCVAQIHALPVSDLQKGPRSAAEP